MGMWATELRRILKQAVPYRQVINKSILTILLMCPKGQTVACLSVSTQRLTYGYFGGTQGSSNSDIRWGNNGQYKAATF